MFLKVGRDASILVFQKWFLVFGLVKRPVQKKLQKSLDTGDFDYKIYKFMRFYNHEGTACIEDSELETP